MWFLFTLFTILAWSGSDLFSKIASKPDDKFSHWKMIMSVGLIMGLHAIYQITIGGVIYDFKSIIIYLPVSFLYITSMIFGYAGLRYIELSISSPICNSSGAIVAVLCFIFLHETLTGTALVAIFLISLGIFLLGLFEKIKDDKERKSNGIKVENKYRIGILALLFPILYCIIDAAGTFADAFYLDVIMDELTCNISYEFTFMIVGIIAAIYVLCFRKEKISMGQDKFKLIAACFETLGQFTYVFALSGNAIVAAPAIASYTVFSVIWSRIFLKEKLNKKQYISVLMVLAGVIILGIMDI